MPDIIVAIFVIAGIALAIATVFMPFFVWSISNGVKEANKTNKEIAATLARIESVSRSGQSSVSASPRYLGQNPK